MCLNRRNPLTIRRIHRSIDFHPAGVQHGNNPTIVPMLNTVFDRLGGYPPRPPESLRSESAGNQHIQRSHGEKRYTRAKGQALGGGSPHAKAGIGTRTRAYTHRVAVLHRNPGGREYLFHQRGGQGRLLPRLRANAVRQNTAILCQAHGQGRGGRFNAQDFGHYSFLRRYPRISSAVRTLASVSMAPSTMNHTMGRLPMP